MWWQGKGVGSCQHPRLEWNNILGLDSFPLGPGSAWGHFCMFANSVCLLALSLSVQIPLYTQVLPYVVCLHLLDAWVLALFTLKPSSPTSHVTLVRSHSNWPFVICAYTTDASVTVLCLSSHGFCCQLVHALLEVPVTIPIFFQQSSRDSFLIIVSLELLAHACTHVVGLWMFHSFQNSDPLGNM